MAHRTAPTVESLTRRLDWANKRCSYAWARYYETVRSDLHEAHIQYVVLNRVVDGSTETVDAIPTHIKNELKEMATALKKKWECPICMDFIPEDNLDITNCGHYYCKGCLEALKASEKRKGLDKWACSVCRRKHNFKENE